MSRCGSCIMCCRATAVPELNKPIHVWCKFVVKEKGCSIYSTRPASCQKYECLYYANENISSDLRPDRCKVIFERLGEYRVYLAMVARFYRLAWQENNVKRLITKLLTDDFAVVVSVEGDNDKHVILPPGRDAQSVFDDVQKFAEQVGILGKSQNVSTVICD